MFIISTGFVLLCARVITSQDVILQTACVSTETVVRCSSSWQTFVPKEYDDLKAPRPFEEDTSKNNDFDATNGLNDLDKMRLTRRRRYNTYDIISGCGAGEYLIYFEASAKNFVCEQLKAILDNANAEKDSTTSSPTTPQSPTPTPTSPVTEPTRTTRASITTTTSTDISTTGSNVDSTNDSHHLDEINGYISPASVVGMSLGCFLLGVLSTALFCCACVNRSKCISERLAVDNGKTATNGDIPLSNHNADMNDPIYRGNSDCHHEGNHANNAFTNQALNQAFLKHQSSVYDTAEPVYSEEPETARPSKTARPSQTSRQQPATVRPPTETYESLQVRDNDQIYNDIDNALAEPLNTSAATIDHPNTDGHPYFVLEKEDTKDIGPKAKSPNQNIEDKEQNVNHSYFVLEKKGSKKVLPAQNTNNNS